MDLGGKNTSKFIHLHCWTPNHWFSRSRQHVDDELRMCRSVQLASATSDRSSSSHSTSMLKVSLKQTWTAAKKTSTGSHDSLSQHNLHNHLAVHLMEWSDKHDLVLCREVLVMEPYQHPYRSNKRGDVWNQIAVNLSGLDRPKFKVNETLRSVHFGVVVEELINCKWGGIVRNEIW